MEQEKIPENLAELLEKNSQRFGEKVAMYFNGRRITYDALSEYSKRFSQGLINLGIDGQKIAILLHNSPEFIISYFGIAQTGSTVVPINTMFKQEEVEFILQDSGAHAIISSAAFLNIVQPIKNKSRILKYIILTDALIPGAINFYEIIERSIVRASDIKISENDVASILYTSGTTGLPKGAMLTHRNFISNALSCISAIGASSHDNIICLLPMFHSFAWTVCVLMSLFVGASITIIDTLRPFRKLIRNVIKKKVTIFVAIPSIYHILSEIEIPSIFTARVLKMIGPVRLCVSGAAALPSAILGKFEEKFNVPLLEGYGLTEASPVVSLNPLKGRKKPGSVGLPIDDVEVQVVDKDGKTCSVDEPGELLVKGPNVMRGYLNKPDETCLTIKKDWLYTGDIAKIDQEGYIYIVDRKKDMINVRGLNVYPKEIENVLMRHPAIKEVAVVRSWDKNKGEVPKAFMVLKEEAHLAYGEIIRFCREHLAEFKIPKNMEFVSLLPKNPLGKVLKRELEKLGDKEIESLRK